MNEFFIKSSFDEIELLEDVSISTIESVIKEYKKTIKNKKIELEYSSIIKSIIDHNLKQKRLARFLNKKFKDGKISDYINIYKTQDQDYKLEIIKYDKTFDLEKGLSSFDKNIYKFEFVRNSPIVNIVTLYESFVRRLITYECLEGNYDLINDEKINFSMLESLNYDNESIKQFMIESYCDTKLFGEKKRIRGIISTLAIDCNDSLDLIDDFDEIYFRRNMYVHSIPNLTTDYLSLPDRIKGKWIKDGQLINSPEYFKHAFDTLNKIYLLILIKKYLYKEQKSDNQKSANMEIISKIIYEKYYYEGRYNIAKFAYFQLKNLKWIEAIDRYYYFVNYMVCLKYTDSETLRIELNKWNTSTDATIFKIAKKLIENDYTNINSMILEVLKENDEFKELNKDEIPFFISKEDILNWPLFKDYRKTEFFKDLNTCEAFNSHIKITNVQ